MKSSELNRLTLRNGWVIVSQRGSHTKFEKEGRIYIATFHGSKEVGKGLKLKIKR